MNIIGIQEARHSEPTNTLIDLVILTDEGKIPFAYVPGSEDEISLYILSNMGQFDITPFSPPFSLDDLKKQKLIKISNAFNTYVSGRVGVSLGWDMQFNQRDITMVFGVVRHMEMTNGTEGYLTDAENVNHYGLSLAEIQSALIDMTEAYMRAHMHKQVLRDATTNATTQAELDAINW